MKTHTKTEIRNNTAKATKLLRGIDNETAQITKGVEALAKRTEKVAKDTAVVSGLLAGLSNAAIAGTEVKPAPKPAAKTAPKPAAKTAAKPAAKTAGVKTGKPAKKPAAKPAAKVAAKTASKKPAAKAAPKPAKKVAAKSAKPAVAAAGERPKLKTVVNGLMDAAAASNGGKPAPIQAAVLYKQVCDAHGYYSRQSLYNALKDEKSYKKVKDSEGEDAYIRIPGSAASGTSDEEAEAFVKGVDSNATAAAAS